MRKIIVVLVSVACVGGLFGQSQLLSDTWNNWDNETKAFFLNGYTVGFVSLAPELEEQFLKIDLPVWASSISKYPFEDIFEFQMIIIGCIPDFDLRLKVMTLSKNATLELIANEKKQ